MSFARTLIRQISKNLDRFTLFATTEGFLSLQGTKQSKVEYLSIAIFKREF